MLIFQIKPYLKERNITLTQMAKEIGISRQSLSAISNNSVSTVQLGTLNKIASYLNVPADKLLIDDPEAIQLEITLGELEPRNEHADMFRSLILINGNLENELNLDLNIIFDYSSISSNNIIVTFEIREYEDFQSSKYYSTIKDADISKNQLFITQLLAKCFKRISNDDDYYHIPTQSDYVNVLVTPDFNDFWSFNFISDIKERFIRPVPLISENDNSKNNKVNYVIKDQ